MVYFKANFRFKTVYSGKRSILFDYFLTVNRKKGAKKYFLLCLLYLGWINTLCQEDFCVNFFYSVVWVNVQMFLFYFRAETFFQNLFLFFFSYFFLCVFTFKLILGACFFFFFFFFFLFYVQFDFSFFLISRLFFFVSV